MDDAGNPYLILAVDPKDSVSKIGDRFPVGDNEETFA
jgi:hypothetical protein